MRESQPQTSYIELMPLNDGDDLGPPRVINPAEANCLPPSRSRASRDMLLPVRT
jgi:hypothetical protein